MIRVYFDGAARPNPGPGAFGVVVLEQEWGGCLGPTTSNRAELAALVAALRLARSLDLEEVELVGDSELALKGFQRAWRVQDPHLKALLEEAWRLAEGLRVEVRWVPSRANPAHRVAHRFLEEVGRSPGLVEGEKEQDQDPFPLGPAAPAGDSGEDRELAQD